MKKTANAVFIFTVIVSLIGGLMFGYTVGLTSVYTGLYEITTNCSLMESKSSCSNLPPTPSWSPKCVWTTGPPSAASSNSSSSSVNNSSLMTERCFFSDMHLAVCDSAEVYRDENKCKNISAGFDNHRDVCRWNAKEGICQHTSSWSPSKTGLYASAYVIGCTLGTLVIGKFAEYFGRKKSLLLIGILATTAALTSTIQQASGSYDLLITSRIILGIAAGAVCVISPLYAEEMAPEESRQPLVVLFQLGVTGGILLTAAMGLWLEPHDFQQDLQVGTKYTTINLVQWIIGLGTLPVAFLMPESTVWILDQQKRKAGSGVSTAPSQDVSSTSSLHTLDYLQKGMDEAEGRNPQEPFRLHSNPEPNRSMEEGEEDNTGKKKGGRYGAVEEEDTAASFPSTTGTVIQVGSKVIEQKAVALPLIILVSVTLTFSMASINAVINYSTIIMGSAGLKPLMGNFLVMLWNFLTSCVAYPFSRRFAPRKLFIVGTAVSALACLLNGIPVFPGWLDISDTARKGLAGAGIFIYILAFEVAMGPVFYTLAVEIFPVRIRATGASFANMIQFVMNIVINYGFPVAVVGLSGGENENQNIGLGLAFILFGAVGLLSVPILILWMYPAPKTEEEPPL